jgi:hypothetical protein
MKTFYGVTILVFLIGMAIVCRFAPWTLAPAGTSAAHASLGYASLWSDRFSAASGARVDWGSFAIMTGLVAFFAIVFGAIAHFFGGKRGPEPER